MGDIDYSSYENVVQYNVLHLKPEEWFFKSSDIYRVILEHVSLESGNEYLELIKNEFTELYEKNKLFLKELINTNDSIGMPVKYNFDFFGSISPTNLRYIYHSFIILSYIKKLNLHTIPIVEIGGGYGGLSYYIHKLSVLFDITIESYTIYDLPIVSVLQKKYLDLFNIQINNTSVNTNSFLISNYAFSELDESYRQKYKDEVIKYCKHGFLAWNFIPLYDFVDTPIHIEVEKPLTGNNMNKFVYF